MHRWRRPLTLFLLLGFSAGGSGLAFEPDAIGGLEAWYEVDSLHRRLNDGDPVPVWSDRSGNGHDLTLAGKTAAGVFAIRQVGDRPAVEIGKNQSYRVTSPFELDDYTIFVVYQSDYDKRVLFRSDAHLGHGVVLAVGRSHVFRSGGMGEPVFSYGESAPVGGAFSITVLGRDTGVLRSFVDGLETSSGNRHDDPIRVGEFFAIRYSQFVDGDGKGLKIAEMLFYDRFLTESERHDVTGYLSDKYGLELRREPSLRESLSAPAGSDDGRRLRLGTDSRAEVNDPEGYYVPWTRRLRTADAFRHDPAKENTRIYCTRDGTRTRLFVSLPYATEKPGVSLRLLILKNGRDWQGQGVTSEPAPADASARPAAVELETTLFLDAGDFIEVAVFGSGAPGSAVILPAEAVLLAEVR